MCVFCFLPLSSMSGPLNMGLDHSAYSRAALHIVGQLYTNSCIGMSRELSRELTRCKIRQPKNRAQRDQGTCYRSHSKRPRCLNPVLAGSYEMTATVKSGEGTGSLVQLRELFISVGDGALEPTVRKFLDAQ